MTNERETDGHWLFVSGLALAMIKFLKLSYSCGDSKNHALINDIKITAELNERCEYIYTLIGPKNIKT